MEQVNIHACIYIYTYMDTFIQLLQVFCSLCWDLGLQIVCCTEPQLGLDDNGARQSDMQSE